MCVREIEREREIDADQKIVLKKNAKEDISTLGQQVLMDRRQGV